MEANGKDNGSGNGIDGRKRRQFSSEQKATAVKRHLQGKEEVSAVCQDLGIAPNLFYRWQQELFDHAAAAFEVKKRGPKRKSPETEMARQVEALEKRIAHKDEVIAEVAEECVALKKKLGRS
jgi:transposase-like protein